MEQLGPSHLGALAVTVAAAAVAVALARARPAGDPALVAWRRALAVAMVLSEATLRTAVYAHDGVRLAFNLPLHLTHWAWLMCVIALWTARPWAFELAWFWAGAAVTQAMVTPSLNHDIPDVRYWHFMAIHAPVLVGVVLLAFGCRLTPRAGAVGRAWVASWGVFAVAATASWVTGGNYMFAREPPPKGSLLDLMGPWPWYLGGAALLALAVFWLLDLPFRARRKRPIPGERQGGKAARAGRENRAGRRTQEGGCANSTPPSEDSVLRRFAASPRPARSRWRRAGR